MNWGRGLRGDLCACAPAGSGSGLARGGGGVGLHNEEDWLFSPCPLPAPGSGRTLAVARVGATLIEGHLGPRGRLEDGGAEKKEGLCRAGAELPGGGMGGRWEGHGLKPMAGLAWEAGGLHPVALLTWTHLVPVPEFSLREPSGLWRPREGVVMISVSFS